MFFIILGIVILSVVISAVKFPNLTSRFTSKLPRINASKWFSNPKIKILLRDREFFNQNAAKIISSALFVVIGNENYRLFNMLTPANEYGAKKDLSSSDEAFDLLEYNDAVFLFVHPSLSKTEKGDLINSRLRLLIERICKYRRQKYIDGIVIVPSAEVYKKTNSPPSKELTNEINFSINVFQKFIDFFKIKIPIYFIANETKESTQLKNVFKKDPLNENIDLYLGFSSNFAKKPENQKSYDFFQSEMTNFEQAFNVKAQSILQNAPVGDSDVSSVYILHTVQEENFFLSKNYISFFLNAFDKYSSVELSHFCILNSVLFASYEGSTTEESLTNLFRYLSIHGKDKMIFSEKFLNHRRRLNFILGIWTLLFLLGGVFAQWEMNEFLLKKRSDYIKKSIVSYQIFAKKFNNILSNKFPFSIPDSRENAYFENIAFILKEFKSLTKGKEAYFLEHINDWTQRADIQNFINSMNEVDSFFNLKITDDAPLPKSFDVGVNFDFRSRPADEYLANRIIDWSFSVGQQNFGSKYGAQKHIEFVWTYGNPLNFKVEFFSKGHENYDPTLVPVKSNTANAQIKGSSHLYVQGNTVVFGYPNDPWSLLRFIADHDICSTAKMACPHPLLQFIIPLANQSNVVFFCNLELQDIDGKTLTVPHFPIVAPLFAKEPNF